ncbi:MAG: hypothetical protein ACK4UO_06115 [Pseudolabrys sp.]
MSERLPFASAMPMAPAPAPLNELPGYAQLVAMRVQARGEAELLAPLCVERFDGAERIKPDADDVKAKANAEALIALVDVILGDRALLTRIGAELARRQP